MGNIYLLLILRGTAVRALETPDKYGQYVYLEIDLLAFDAKQEQMREQMG